MDIQDKDIKELLDKRIRLITSIGYTYVGQIISFGSDYVKFIDKNNTTRFISKSEIIKLEVLENQI